MDKLQIAPKDCKFFVDKEKRIVVCIISDVQMALYQFLEEKYDWFNFWEFKKIIRLPKTFVGIAKCAPEDTWDESIGKQIAYDRAKTTFARTFFSKANDCVNAIDRKLGLMIEEFNAYGRKLERNANRRKAKIKEKVGEA